MKPSRLFSARPRAVLRWVAFVIGLGVQSVRDWRARHFGPDPFLD